jgi:hypothetical protein
VSLFVGGLCTFISVSFEQQRVDTSFAPISVMWVLKDEVYTRRAVRDHTQTYERASGYKSGGGGVRLRSCIAKTKIVLLLFAY